MIPLLLESWFLVLRCSPFCSFLSPRRGGTPRTLRGLELPGRADDPTCKMLDTRADHSSAFRCRATKSCFSGRSFAAGLGDVPLCVLLQTLGPQPLHSDCVGLAPLTVLGKAGEASSLPQTALLSYTQLNPMAQLLPLYRHSQIIHTFPPVELNEFISGLKTVPGVKSKISTHIIRSGSWWVLFLI